MYPNEQRSCLGNSSIDEINYWKLIYFKKLKLSWLLVEGRKNIAYIIISLECSVQGQVLHCKHRNLDCSSAKAGVPPQIQEPRLQFNNRLNRCGSVPLLSTPHSPFSIWTYLKRSEKIPGVPTRRWGEWIWLTGPSGLHWNSPQGLNISSIRVFDQSDIWKSQSCFAPHSLFSIWTNLKRSEKYPGAPMWRWGEWIWLTGPFELHRNSSQELNISSIKVFNQLRYPQIPIMLRTPLSLFGIWTALKRSESTQGHQYGDE